MYVLRKDDDDISIHFDENAFTICNGEAVARVDPRTAKIVAAILDHAPSPVRTEHIERLVEDEGVGGQYFTLYLRNKLSAFRKIVKAVAPVEGVIVNVRGVGYRLADGWSAKKGAETANGNNAVKGLVDRLTEFASRTIGLSEQLSMREDRDSSGVTTLALNTHGFEKEISQHHAVFQGLSREIMNRPPFQGDIKAIMRMSYLLSTVESYVLMSRQGSGISESTWRRLFREELIKLIHSVAGILSGF